MQTYRLADVQKAALSATPPASCPPRAPVPPSTDALDARVGIRWLREYRTDSEFRVALLDDHRALSGLVARTVYAAWRAGMGLAHADDGLPTMFAFDRDEDADVVALVTIAMWCRWTFAVGAQSLHCSLHHLSDGRFWRFSDLPGDLVFGPEAGPAPKAWSLR